MHTLNEQWKGRLDNIDYAFQPIVNIHNGTCYGYEALLRNHAAAGFPTIGAVFDDAFAEGVLHKVDMYLRHRALTKYAQIPWSDTTKLFYNIDNRLLNSPDYDPGDTTALLNRLFLSNGNLVFEISERHELSDKEQTVNILEAYRKQGYRIAVDDCGTGFSGLQLLYYTEPDCIKIDRFFIQDIEADAKKRLFVSSIVEIAHLMGSTVVAEGVETLKEYYSCRNIGCDLVQGYFVQEPRQDIGALKQCYQEIELLSTAEKRSRVGRDQALVRTELTYIPPIHLDANIIDVFETFRTNKDNLFFPVTDSSNALLGIIRESSFKEFAYSRFGRQLLENPNFGGNLHRFISRFPVADVHAPVEKILKIFAQNDANEGVIILDGLIYMGFLSAMSLLKIVNEKNLLIAREQNPLTKLPGNTLIYEYISGTIADRDAAHHLVYFDFDNFKAYNDQYGFRHGDRLLLRFAEILREENPTENRFVGHIGGDDFFMGFRDTPLEWVMESARRIAGRFRRDAESFYNREDRTRGFIPAKGRDGHTRQAPLITVSAGILSLPSGPLDITTAEDIGNIIAALKKGAKSAPDNLCVASVRTASRCPRHCLAAG